MEDKRFDRLLNLLDESKETLATLCDLWDMDIADVVTEIFATGLDVHEMVLEQLCEDEEENLRDADDKGEDAE